MKKSRIRCPPPIPSCSVVCPVFPDQQIIFPRRRRGRLSVYHGRCCRRYFKGDPGLGQQQVLQYITRRRIADNKWSSFVYGFYTFFTRTVIPVHG